MPCARNEGRGPGAELRGGRISGIIADSGAGAHPSRGRKCVPRRTCKMLANRREPRGLKFHFRRFTAKLSKVSEPNRAEFSVCFSARSTQSNRDRFSFGMFIILDFSALVHTCARRRHPIERSECSSSVACTPAQNLFSGLDILGGFAAVRTAAERERECALLLFHFPGNDGEIVSESSLSVSRSPLASFECLNKLLDRGRRHCCSRCSVAKSCSSGSR